LSDRPFSKSENKALAEGSLITEVLLTILSNVFTMQSSNFIFGGIMATPKELIQQYIKDSVTSQDGTTILAGVLERL